MIKDVTCLFTDSFAFFEGARYISGGFFVSLEFDPDVLIPASLNFLVSCLISTWYLLAILKGVRIYFFLGLYHTSIVTQPTRLF